MDSGICWSWIIAIVVLLDQISKNLVVSLFEFNRASFLNQYLNITLVKNTGAAFSFLADGYAWQFWFLLVFNISMIAMLFLWLLRSRFESYLYNISLVLIISGAVSNLIDRVSYGYVVDFIEFHVSGLHWPIFNLADVAIVVGALSYIYASNITVDK